ncbi:hypothetical protein [Herpetosiphon gulosus]|uniref:Yip1 domain-containing protein n=1 Tax=Herpetosiphon gulosus TaxID=1973496 RepID=A0ABP9X218_9CHLR
MSEEPQSAISATAQPPITSEPLATANSVQGYHVPITSMADHNQPSRWRWFGINCLAFVISGILYPILTITFLFAIGSINVQLPLIDNQRALKPNLFVLLSIPVFITIYIASLIQRAAINEDFKRWAWSLNSATAGTLTFITVGYQIISRDSISTLSSYLWLIFFIFGFTSSAISWIQWRELRNVVDNAWQWVLISVITWTGLGTLIFGAGIGFWIRSLMQR